MSDNPYEATPVQPSYPGGPDAKPQVWTWYVIYCVLMALLYLLCLAGGIMMLVFTDAIVAEDPSVTAAELRIQGGILSVIGFVLFLVFAFGPFVPRSKFGWIYGFVPIGLGLTSLCCLPATIPLLLGWIGQQNKDYFKS